jgi:hypothetical protein
MGRTIRGHRRRKTITPVGTKAYLEPDEVARLEESATSFRERRHQLTQTIGAESNDIVQAVLSQQLWSQDLVRGTWMIPLGGLWCPPRHQQDAGGSPPG